jgi:hypothetical protein
MAQRKLQGRRHAVRFYGDDQSLFKTVGGFLSEGLVAGEPAIVIATGNHQQGIVEELGARLIDVERARRLGDIVLLDADETMALFMTPDGPNADLFERYVGRVIDQTVRGHRQSMVRAYGEMVDILWQQGEIDGALQLEVLWKQLASKYAFSLLCAYAIGAFHDKAELMERVRAHHTDVVDPESNVLPFTPRQRS